ncbi:hypothetical protein CEXT_254061 [Caerostris extrusa]|uniref:Uncharacterized protein n=1 Tax=Caerostris extrusa TaxID=172846 RepID=A0AAV4SMM5_CAEEX|nr:hypothetical protein CEXT_254061 [Caerostris extrusa]
MHAAPEDNLPRSVSLAVISTRCEREGQGGSKSPNDVGPSLIAPCDDVNPISISFPPNNPSGGPASVQEVHPLERGHASPSLRSFRNSPNPPFAFKCQSISGPPPPGGFLTSVGTVCAEASVIRYEPSYVTTLREVIERRVIASMTCRCLSSDRAPAPIGSGGRRDKAPPQHCY